MMTKPHLFILVWVVLLTDSIRRRSFRVLIWMTVMLLVGSLCSLCYDPKIFTHYLNMTRDVGIQGEFIPAPATVFRLLLNRDKWILQLVPAVIGQAWALAHYIRKREHWEWNRETPLLLLVSVFISPYAWFSDEVALAPGIIQVLYALRTQAAGHSQRKVLVLAGLNMIACLMVFGGIPMSSGAYIWTSAAWLGWYLYASRDTARAAQT
jgi:hypothetical protein